MQLSKILISLFIVSGAHAENLQTTEKAVLADLKLLNSLGLPVIESREDVGVGLAVINEKEEERLSVKAHENGKCAGYQVLTTPVFQRQGNTKIFSFDKIQSVLKKFDKGLALNHKSLHNFGGKTQITDFNPAIKDAVKEVGDSNIGSWVEWLAGFGGRFHASSNPNVHTVALVDRLNQMIAQLNYPAKAELVEHRRTGQKTVRLTLTGSKRPTEIVVLGGHLDSINHQFSGNKNNAPGADDNASGSAALLEALRVVLKQGQPERTIQFFWYAAEEVGLYGSTEIAEQYSAEKKDVIGVIQLDMTMHPGSGEGVISSVTDFTSDWLKKMLLELNTNYINVKIIDDRCGYACSDHAPWFNEGYPTLMPFESHTDTMNGKIHTPNDTLNASSSLKHAAIFSKIAVAYAMTLANSTLRHP
jgi:bacterial leucyl aminopeptidase